MLMVTTAIVDFGNVSKKPEEPGVEAETRELQRIPNNTTNPGVEEAKKVLRLIEKLEDDDDVQKYITTLK